MLVFLLGLGVFLLDQLTKQAVRSHLYPGESRPVIEGFFNLVHVRNDGAAWNILSGRSPVLIAVSVGVLAVLFFYRRAFLRDRLHRVILGLMIGGILGNLADRIRFGTVTDFLDFQFGSYHYPAFNIADSALCIAAALFIFASFAEDFRKKREERRTEPTEQEDDEDRAG